MACPKCQQSSGIVTGLLGVVILIAIVFLTVVSSLNVKTASSQQGALEIAIIATMVMC